MDDAGLVRVGEHTWAYLQGDGGFGLSNAGVVAADGDGLLVDTLFDLPRTRRLLAAIDESIGATLRTLVNTHDNGDHCFGNQLVAERGAEIVAHVRCAAAFGSLPPAVLQGLSSAAVADTPLGRYFAPLVAAFDFDGIELTPPTVTFGDDGTTRVLGETEVRLISVGPAHTAGDAIVHVPEDGVVYTGDVVFRGCHPLLWDGTYAQWLTALDAILATGAPTVVPGHGPVCGPDGVREQAAYLRWVREAARELFDRGVPFDAAALTLDPGPYGHYGEPERVVFCVERAYREFAGGRTDGPDNAMALFALMAQRCGF